MAIATLVHNILNVESNSLILLDEPEISLHPGAKKRLKLFLLEQIKRKHLQIVISTHSSNIIEGLPPQAIKVFVQLPNGKFHVKEKSYPEEAFFYIGQKPTKEYIIIVEDKLSKEIINSVLNEKGQETASLFKIEFYPGGHSVIKKDFITVYSQESKKNKFIIFDGDQKPQKGHFNPAEISISDISPENFDETILKLNEKIKDQIGFEIDFNTDGNSSGGNKKQKIDLMIKYLKFYYENVFYLPLLIPEAIIWDEEVIRHYLEFKSDREKIMDEIRSTTNYKDKFRIFSLALSRSEDGENILFVQKVLLNNWLEKKDDNYKEILAIINKILI